MQNVKKLVQENNIDALIGPSTTPNAFAILDVIAENKVPMMATVGTSAVVEPLDAKKRWVFKTTQNDDLIAAALLKHMAKNGVKTVGFIGFNDPYGDNWLKVFTALGEKAGVKVVATERFNRTDQSVTGQTLKMIAAKPDAMLIAAVRRTPRCCRRRRCATRVTRARSTTRAVATKDFIKLGKDKVEGAILAAGPMLVIDEIADSNPTKKIAQNYIAQYQKQFSSVPATFGANTSIRACCSARVLPRSRSRSPAPRHSAWRCVTRSRGARGRRLPGVFNMSADNHNGMDEQGPRAGDGEGRQVPARAGVSGK